MSLDVAAIAAWLADTDIAELELTGPATHLHLRRRGRAVEPVAEPVPSITVRAPEAGQFLQRHPMRDEALTLAGQSVAAGDIVGLLRVGALLLPVAAPCAGKVAGHWAAHGAVVGYDDALLELHVLPE